jgi:tetratricopeptide (TPR) repeat protein
MPDTFRRITLSFTLAVTLSPGRLVGITHAQSTQNSSPASEPAPATSPATAPAGDQQAMLRSALELQVQAYTTDKPFDYQAAASAMEQCSALMPDDVKLQRELGFLYFKKLHDAAHAYPHLDHAHSLEPHDADWALLLAAAAGDLGKTDQQRQLINDVLKADPNNQDARDALTALKPATNPAAQPTTEPARATSQSTGPTTPLQQALDLQTQAYTTNNLADFQAAADALERCSKAEPTNLQVEQSLGYLFLDKLKKPDRAYPHLENAWKLDSTDPGWGSLLARCAGDIGNPARQMQVLRQVVRDHADNANAHLELAQALEKAGAHGEAGAEFATALKLSPDNDNISLAYAQYLHGRGQDQQARKRVEDVLNKDPSSAEALALRGDLLRAEWNLEDAQTAYQQALATDPYSEAAKTGVTEIHKSQAPSLETSYYYFAGSDKFMQQGLYNTLSFSASSHVYLNATYNMGYFRDSPTHDPSVLRYQEGVGIEDRIDSVISIRGGLGAFQQPHKEAFGFNIAGTWKPTNELWVDVSYRTDDPVNDSMFTVHNALSQDVLGITGGYQATDDLSVKVTTTRSIYSDDSVREFVNVEPDYTLWQTAQLKAGVEYEAYRYSKSIPGAGGPNWYQTIGPVVELEPPVTPWLSLHARAEFPYVVTASQWGSNLNLELKLHPNDHLEVKAGVFYVRVPESISSYSGTGFDASLSYRF